MRLLPLTPIYHLSLAQIQQELGDYPAAEAQLATAERLSPKDPLIWQAQADLFLAWGEVEPARLDQAAALARRLVDYAPSLGTHHTRLGVVLARQGDLSHAALALETAADLDRTDVAAFSDLAILYQALDRPSDADLARQIAEILNETYTH